MASRLFEEVCEQVRRDISIGQLRPGDKLASERELAEQLKVGRPVVREALRSLEEAGILEFRRGVTGGAFIRSGDTGTVTRSMTDLIFLGAVSLDGLTEARSCVLRFTAERAAERGTEADFDNLEQNVAESVRLFDQLSAERQVSFVGEFYEHLARAAHNDVLIIMIRSLSPIVAEILLKTRPNVLDEVIASRTRLIAHLRARNVTAAGEEIASHLARLHETVVDNAARLHHLHLSPARSRSRIKAVQKPARKRRTTKTASA